MAQGCSDAGFCTLGAMQSGHALDSAMQQKSIGFSFSAGAGENGTAIISPQLEGKFAVGRNSVIEGKLPYNVAYGNKGSHSGIGDLIITYTHSFSKEKSNWKAFGTAATRLSLGKADATDDGRPLPMPYQSNLGTTDLIAGLSISYKQYLNIAAGYQQPIVQYNMNGYEPPMLYPAMPVNEDYFASRRLQRKGDLLLRAEGSWQWKRITLAAGPLFIYHLGMDRTTTLAGNDVLLKGSEGLTLNLAGTFSYSYKRGRLDLLAGTPLIVRDYRPDGLTRAWVITLRVSHFLR